MSIDRVATSTQSSYMTSQLMKAESEVSKYTTQVATGQVSTSYAGYGDQTQALESARSVVNRTKAYQTATNLALTQTELQDTYLSQLSTLASELKDALSSAVADGDAAALNDTVSDIFDQVVAILNAKDSSGNYIFGGGNNTDAPVSVTSFEDLVSLASSDDAFQNGSAIKTVQVSDSLTMNIGVLADDAGSDILSCLKDIADYIDSNGEFTETLDDADTTFLTDAITSATTAYKSITKVEALNGNTNSRLTDIADEQTTLLNLYEGFVDDIQSVDMTEAATNLEMANTALQAVVQVTASLNSVSLLDYLS